MTTKETHQEREISAGFQRGERWAFEAAAREYFAHLLNFVAQLLGDRDRALELTQEAFFLACRAHKQVDALRPLGPWLFQIARNLAYKEFARRKKQPTAALDDEMVENDLKQLSSEDNPRVERTKGETMERVNRALNRLKPKYRDLLTLRLMQGMPSEKVAELMKIPVPTVNTRIHRALKQLRRFARLEGIREDEVFL